MESFSLVCARSQRLLKGQSGRAKNSHNCSFVGRGFATPTTSLSLGVAIYVEGTQQKATLGFDEADAEVRTPIRFPPVLQEPL